MLGILYLFFCSFVGYNLLKLFVPELFKISKEAALSGKAIKLSNWMLTLPASFLTGTLFVTWITYLLTWIIAYLFPGIKRPLIYGNLITFLILSAATAIILLKKKDDFREFFIGLKKIDVPTFNKFVLTHKTELIFVTVCTILWSFIMIKSFYVEDNTMNVGLSVFSDFGAHIPMIRSFSEGTNFPTEYPHFGSSNADSITGNNIRYHFMFMFLAGNLEFLGMRIDWAFNLPSILAIVFFLMLLYSFVILIFGNRLTGILAAVLFFFRSSFAVFTYAVGLNLENAVPASVGSSILKYIYMFKQFLLSVLKSELNIGKTMHEDWGFYAQKVFVNKRHYCFALGIAMLVLIIVFPLFRKMIARLKKSRKNALKKTENLNLSKTVSASNEDNTVATKTATRILSIIYVKLNYWLKEFLLCKDSWLTLEWSYWLEEKFFTETDTLYGQQDMMTECKP